MKPKVRPISVKKTITVSRLQKCYICNQHFNQQEEFDLHLKQHQEKLSRTNIDQLQRKTQQSFRNGKTKQTLNLTQKITIKHEKTQQKQQQTRANSHLEDEEDLQESARLENALRQSQIMLQKIQFLTQIEVDEEQKPKQDAKIEDIQIIEKTIPDQHALLNILRSRQKQTDISLLILKTNFSDYRFENYQEQLNHLRALTYYAIDPQSKSDIDKIRQRICKQILEQLDTLQKPQEKQIKTVTQTEKTPTLQQNQGNLLFCSDCLDQIKCSQMMYSLQCGHSYHQNCWEGKCCS